MNNSQGADRGEVVVYEAPDGEIRVDVRLEKDTVWLSLGQMAELFGRDKSVISRHLRSVFLSGELDRAATVAKNATVQREGARGVVRDVEFYNLDAILSVGYRVSSKRGTQFRIWATTTLREHLLRGYTINRQRPHDLSADTPGTARFQRANPDRRCATTRSERRPQNAQLCAPTSGRRSSPRPPTIHVRRQRLRSGPDAGGSAVRPPRFSAISGRSAHVQPTEP